MFGLSLASGTNSLNMFGVFSVMALDCKECIFMMRVQILAPLGFRDQIVDPSF